MALLPSCRRKQNAKQGACSVEVAPYTGHRGEWRGVGADGGIIFRASFIFMSGYFVLLDYPPPLLLKSSTKQAKLSLLYIAS